MLFWRIDSVDLLYNPTEDEIRLCGESDAEFNPDETLHRWSFYNVSESKLPKIQQISLKIIIFTVDKRLQTVITRENLFFRSFLEVSSGICVQILRFRNKILPFAL